MSTHFLFFGLPSTDNSNRSGHSHWPLSVPPISNELRKVQFFKSLESKKTAFLSSARTATITHFLSASYQNTLGSRKSGCFKSAMGFPSYSFQVRPRSLLNARCCLCMFVPAAVYIAIKQEGSPESALAHNPLELCQSTTALPE